jgi:hypothetical protein
LLIAGVLAGGFSLQLTPGRITRLAECLRIVKHEFTMRNIVHSSRNAIPAAQE